MREFKGCDCIEVSMSIHGDRGQVCPEYEAWCSEAESEEWWNSLSFEEKDEIIQDGVAYELQRQIDGLLFDKEAWGVQF